jgi:hypothetical protein
MRKLLITGLVAAALIPSIAMAHTTRHELRRDRQAIAEERHEYRRALAYGSPRKIREERREFHAARHEYHRDLRAFGRQHHRHPGRRWH